MLVLGITILVPAVYCGAMFSAHACGENWGKSAAWGYMALLGLLVLGILGSIVRLAFEEIRMWVLRGD
jgi:hypothetical protein